MPFSPRYALYCVATEYSSRYISNPAGRGIKNLVCATGPKKKGGLLGLNMITKGMDAVIIDYQANGIERACARWGYLFLPTDPAYKESERNEQTVRKRKAPVAWLPNLRFVGPEWIEKNNTIRHLITKTADTTVSVADSLSNGVRNAIWGNNKK